MDWTPKNEMVLSTPANLRTDRDKHTHPPFSTLMGESEHDNEAAISSFLRERVPEFRRLDRLRQQGWENPAGDRFFQAQRSNADKIGDKETSEFHYRLMQRIATELHNSTDGCFTTTTKPGAILDVCAAPGGFLAAAISLNDPNLQVRAFTLPFSQGGYKVLLPYQQHDAYKISYLDVTMLAEDMGVEQNEIPSSHPDHDKFLPRQFATSEQHYYDVAICDGHVLRTQERSSYRERRREYIRLQTSSFVLALEHLEDQLHDVGNVLALAVDVEAHPSGRTRYVAEVAWAARLQGARRRPRIRYDGA